MFKPTGQKTVERYPIRSCFIGLGRQAFLKCVMGATAFHSITSHTNGKLSKIGGKCWWRLVTFKKSAGALC